MEKPTIENKPAKPAATPGSSQEKKKGGKGPLIAILAVLLAGAIGLFTWQFMKTGEAEQKNQDLTTKNEQLGDSVSNVKAQLTELSKQYADMENSNAELKTQLQGERQRIEEALAEIDKQKKTIGSLSKYKKLVEELNKSREVYLAQIDSLKAQNQQLATANDQMRGEMQRTQSEKDALGAQVAKGSIIKGTNLVAECFNAKGKPADKAKRVAEIKACVTLVANEIAKPGEKTMYIRIVAPKGDILVSDPANTFTDSRGEALAFSAKSTVDYQNAEAKPCLSYKMAEGTITTGVYDIELFLDGNVISSTSVTLK